MLSLTVCAGNFLSAATVFTQDGRVDGELKRQTDKEIAVQPKNAAEVVVPRERITAVYDDEGKLLWSHPSIVKNDATPDAKSGTKLEIPGNDVGQHHKGIHVGVVGGYGIGYGNSTFSTYPISTGPGYAGMLEIGANLAWYSDTTGAWTGGIAWARREVAIQGINAVNLGAQGNGYWPIQFIDLRVGYRFHSGIFFLEPGLLFAIKTADAPITILTASSSVTGTVSDTQQKSFVAISLALGIKVPVAERFHFLAFIRVDHGVTPVLTGNLATSEGAANYGQPIVVTSTAPVSLLLLEITGQLGLTYRL